MISDILAHHLWLWPLAWQSTLCLAAGLGGSFLPRRHAVRAHQVLLLGLVAAVLIPALSQIVKQNQWGLLVAERAVTTPQHAPAAVPGSFVIPDESLMTQPANVPQPTGVREAVPAPANTRFDWTRAVLPAWLTISSILLLRLVLQFLLGRRLARRSETVDDVELLRMIDAVKDKLGLRAEVRVRSSAQARSPVIWCWGRQPVLLVPQESRRGEGLDWPSILCHELAHAKRRDHVSGLLAEVMVCVLPWQPLLWWARQRLAALSEEACDDWVIASGRRATGYARTLLGLTAQGQAAFLPGVVTSRHGLAGRIHRILEDGCRDPRPGLRWTLAIVALTAGVSLSLAFAQTRPAPRAGTEAKSSAASREQLDKILDAMLYHDRAVFPIALHADIDLYDLDAPADSRHNQTYVFEQRLDGKRLDCLMNVYRLRDDQFQHQQVNRRVFDGEQFVYRQQSIGGSSYRLHASLYSKDEATRIMAYEYMWGCTLFGYLPGDEKTVATLLESAADVVLHDRREEVDGFSCHVIEGRTDHGAYKLWVDPAHGYRIRRAVIDKGPGDLWYGKPVSTPPPEGVQDHARTSVHVEISDLHLVRIGGRFIPTVESETTTTRKSNGKEDHYKVVVKRSQIDLNPDFEKLGAFVMDGIPEGAPVANFDPNDYTYAYEWHNGKVVSVAPDGGIVVGRIQFPGHADLGTVLTGRRSFDAWFKPEGPGKKDTHLLTVRPEKSGVFQVKDVPPGKYGLSLSLTDLVFEKAPSGGFTPCRKILAQADREFAIPEGQDAVQRTVGLGVIEMTLAGPAEFPGGADAGKGADAARGTPGRKAKKTEALPQAPAAPPDKPADDLAGICQAMESAIKDVSVSYEWYVCPPPKIEDLPKAEGTKGPRLIAKGPEKCIWVAKQPFGERYLSITTMTTADAEGESFDNTLMYSSNGETAKHLNMLADLQTNQSYPPHASVSKASASVAPLPVNHTPMAFSVLRLSLQDAKTSLSRSLRKKGFVDVNETVRKINGFNTVCASLLSDTPAIPAAHKQPYLRICFSVDHGYTPVRYEYLSPGKSGPRLNFMVDVNSLAQVAEGLWFPMGGSLGATDSNLRNVYKANKVAVNRPLTDKYFTIEFPPGTWVSDQITGRTYVVEPGQSRFDQWLNNDEWLRQARIVGKKEPAPQGSRPK